MATTVIGVRHHSPACARLVGDTIRALRPVHVLVEGPADFNDRIDELFLGHELPVAIFSSYRDSERHHASWSPFCAHSPEWVAFKQGRAVGATVRFCDLPAWHPAFAATANRYSDAERRHAAAIRRLCEACAVDDIDTLWDHLFEVGPGDRLAAELEAYFDLVRGDAAPSDSDRQREAYMAEWVRAAVADAAGRPVVVVTGGFHRPALVASAADTAGAAPGAWPAVPRFAAEAVGGSYLVPFSFKRLDAFDGYESGMPSPRYYRRLWEAGPAAAGDEIVRAVAQRLRRRRQPVSTADLIAARTLARALARMRGHPEPSRTDVLDGLVSALVTDALERPLPWSGRGTLAAGTDPVVVEMVAALTGDAVGRLHPDTPHPPLVAAVDAELERHAIAPTGPAELDLATDTGRAASRVLHRLAQLDLPGVRRRSGPAPGAAPQLTEAWELERTDRWLPALIEAASYGATLEEAAGAALHDRLAEAGADPDALAEVLFDAVLCGLDELAGTALEEAGRLAGTVAQLGGLGRLLATVLGLWRHDRLLGAGAHAALSGVIAGATARGLWLVEGVRGGAAPADDARIGAVVALRDAIVHAGPVLDVTQDAAAAVFARARTGDRPPDLRGAAVAAVAQLDPSGSDAEGLRRAVLGAAHVETLGDFLAGLFAVGREAILADGTVLAVLDELVAGFDADDFLVALPALRLAFAYFAPRERERIAEALLERRGGKASARSLLRLSGDPEQLARAHATDARVDALLEREALLAAPESADGG